MSKSKNLRIRLRTLNRLQEDYLKSVLAEIEELAKQKVNQALIGAVIRNATERANIDKLIHSDLIFK